MIHVICSLLMYTILSYELFLALFYVREIPYSPSLSLHCHMGPAECDGDRSKVQLSKNSQFSDSLAGPFLVSSMSFKYH